MQSGKQSGRRFGERADSPRHLEFSQVVTDSGVEGGFVADRRVHKTETGLLSKLRVITSTRHLPELTLLALHEAVRRFFMIAC